MTTVLRWRMLWLALVTGLLTATAVAHPLPNSLVTVRPGFGRITFEIHTPAPDLAIAMRTDRSVTVINATTVGRYYLRHVALADGVGRPVPLKITAARLIDATDPDVGRYSEWRVFIAAPAMPGGGSQFVLSYDAVIHQIPNHVAFVRIEAGPGCAAGPRDVGVISYDFATRSIEPISMDLETGSMTSGFTAIIATGFFHVLSGLDHILFLIALLMVVPFKPAHNRWHFVGMNGEALRRFLAISGAFTLGHSVSLAAGTFGFDAVPVQLTEVLVAVSIIVAALHALRPIFPKREWMVAGGFGLIHGLAFSETLAALDLDVDAKIAALFGFNIGVEAAQLIVMIIALPALTISGAEWLARPRQLVLLTIGGLASLWILQRIGMIALPGWLIW